MPTQLVSIGQGAASSLAAWLTSQLPPDCTVYDRWPEPNVELWAPQSVSGQPARLVFTIARVGKRTRLDVLGHLGPVSIVSIGSNQYQVTFTLGSYIQPLQLDVWAQSDVDRDDAIARLDTILNVGAAATGAGATDLDPVRDGVLLPLKSPFSGFVDCWLDEPEILDSSTGNQIAEYRATYFGEARGTFQQVAVVSAMSRIVLAQQLSALATPPPGTLWNLATITPNANPPPAGTVGYSTSSNP